MVRASIAKRYNVLLYCVNGKITCRRFPAIKLLQSLTSGSVRAQGWAAGWGTDKNINLSYILQVNS